MKFVMYLSIIKEIYNLNIAFYEKMVGVNKALELYNLVHCTENSELVTLND